jgi:hypothetical protein
MLGIEKKFPIARANIAIDWPSRPSKSPPRSYACKRPQRDLQHHQRRPVRLGKHLARHRRVAGHAAGRSRAPLSLDRDIRPREAEWETIRARHGLRSGNLRDFVGLSCEYADYTMGYGRNQPGPPAIVSAIKRCRPASPR